MPSEAARNHAVRAALGAVLASSLTYFEPLWALISHEAQPLLPSAAVMAVLSAGTSVEEVMWLSFEGFLGTLGAVLNAVLGRWLTPLRYVPTDSPLALVVLLEATIFVIIVCLSPASESVKMYTVSLCAYFMMGLFTVTELSVAQQCTEYLLICTFGSFCAVVAYALPLPGVPDAHGLTVATHAFQKVSDGCADVILEATAALLGQGAGESWRSIARSRLTELSSLLQEAHAAVEYVDWAPTYFLRRLRSRWSFHQAAVERAQLEAAFQGAHQAIDTCKLLCELAIGAHVRGGSIGTATVQTAASACLTKVSQQAAALLRDITRLNLMQVSACASGEQQLVRERREQLRRSTRSALRNSSIAAKELLMIGLYYEVEDTQFSQQARREFMAARADMAAFLFLIHSLAADLLRIERLTLKSVKEEDAADDGASDGEADAAEDEEAGERLGNESQVDFMALERPLLPKPARSTTAVFRNRVSQSQCCSAFCSWALQPLRQGCRSGMSTVVDNIRFALKFRWRIAVKVSLTFSIAFAASVYNFNLDSTLVCAVATLSSYGSQYDGGSLRRATTRAIGVAAGATVGSLVEAAMRVAFSDAYWLQAADDYRTGQLEPGVVANMASLVYQGTAAVAFVSLVFLSTYCNMLLYFREGQYRYAGYCAAFTAVKFLLCSSAGCLAAGNSITSNMYAGLLAVFVEMTVLPIYAGDLLRTRLAAALKGASVALGALVSADRGHQGFARQGSDLESATSQAALMPASSGALQLVREESPVDLSPPEPLPEGALPDLSNRLRQAGIYEKYLLWREGYMKWRAGEGKGAKGELEKEAGEGSGDAAPQPALAAALTQAKLAPGEAQPQAPMPPAGSFADVQAGEQDAHRGVSFAPAVDTATLPEGAVMDNVSGCVVVNFALDSVAMPTQEETGEKTSRHIMLDGTDTAFEGGVADFLKAEGMEGIAAEDVGPTMQQQLPDLGLEAPLIASLLENEGKPAEEGQGGNLIARTGSSMRSFGHESDLGALTGDSEPRALGIDAPTVSLAKVQELLEEIDALLAPSSDLASQAAERLDATRVDVHTWQRLACVLGIVRLRLSLLARIALRLHHGVSVQDLMGGEESAAITLMAGFGSVLAAATTAVQLGTAPQARTCAELEARLRSSGEALTDALDNKRKRMTSRQARATEITAEVLAGTASHTLTALLNDAGELLALACALSDAANLSSDQAFAPGEVLAVGAAPEEAAAAAEGPGPDSPGVLVGSDLALPDLTERLKEAGMYDKYVEWREGYMRWRKKEGKGAAGEVVQQGTT